jgi:hypothetical protein
MKKTSKIWVKKGIILTFTLTKNNTNFDTIGHIRSIKCVFEKSKTFTSGTIKHKSFDPKKLKLRKKTLL